MGLYGKSIGNLLVMPARARERKQVSHIPGTCYPQTSRSLEAIPTLAFRNPTKFLPVKAGRGRRRILGRKLRDVCLPLTTYTAIVCFQICLPLFQKRESCMSASERTRNGTWT